MTVDRIEVLVDFDPPRSLIHSRPVSSLEGKFSMQYCLAAALLDQSEWASSPSPTARCCVPRPSR